MRLINVKTRQLEEFWDETGLKYAILSHKWEDGEEISYADFLSLSSMSPSSSSISATKNIATDSIREKEGYMKIHNACLQASHDSLNYLWVDTCCINKDSSAEVSEAINSMFRWYRNSTVCYVYLLDVRLDLWQERKGPGSLVASVWLTRGWTLQELLAPQAVAFYDRSWEFLGTKQTLSSTINKVTGIDIAILDGGDIHQRSVAERMSWAASRKTSRVEDAAYSLLGIFDVNIPIMYGEGPNAFIRLQEAIIQRCSDHSIFAWSQESDKQTGLLASSPQAFAPCRFVRSVSSRQGKSAYSVTNQGVQLELEAIPWSVDTYLVKLHCVDELMHNSDTPIEQDRLGMFLRRLDEDDQFIRVRYDGQTFVQFPESRWETKKLLLGGKSRFRHTPRVNMYVRQSLPTGLTAGFLKERVNGFRLIGPELLEITADGEERFRVQTPSWSSEACVMSAPPGRPGTIGQIDISTQNRKIKVIKLGFDFEYNPVCFVAESGGLERSGVSSSVPPPSLSSSTTTTQQQPKPKPKHDVEEKFQHESIYERSCFDTSSTSWSAITNTNKALQLPHHKGLWALKADRITGLNVHLADDETSSTNIKISRGELGDRLVWDVYVGGMKDGFLRRLDRHQAQHFSAPAHQQLHHQQHQQQQQQQLLHLNSSGEGGGGGNNARKEFTIPTPTTKKKEKEEKIEQEPDEEDREKVGGREKKSAFQRFKSNW